MREIPYELCDVFTDRLLAGNALAVFTEADDLDAATMQALARETNLSESAFVRRSAQPGTDAAIRIFTPTMELPFAGHPTLGTATALHQRVTDGAVDRIFLDLKVGKVPVSFSDREGGMFGEMTQIDPTFGATHDRATVAGLLGLQPPDISEQWPIQTVSTGIPFAIAPLKRLSTLQSLRPNAEKVRAYFAQEKDPIDFYYITRDTGDSNVTIRSRGLFSTGEDAATGSASGCTISWMVRHGLVPPDQSVHNLQGVEMKRPSHIFMRARKEGDKITNVRVGGYAVEIAEGDYVL